MGINEEETLKGSRERKFVNKLLFSATVIFIIFLWMVTNNLIYSFGLAAGFLFALIVIWSKIEQ